ncbi:MAG: hypothetical protein P4L87_25140 [Formivibrio sp.]|nr:hypothetical protein [Formivibrio sp.]
MATMKKSEFARHMGVKPSYVTQLIKDNRLVLDASGDVLVEESKRRINDTKDPAKIAVAARHAAARGAELPTSSHEENEAPAVPPSTEEWQFQDSRAKREHFAAKREEIAYRKDAGELLETAAVVSVVSDAVTILRGKLESLPDQIAPQLAAMSDEQGIRAMLAEYVEEALENVARQFSGIVEAAK